MPSTFFQCPNTQEFGCPDGSVRITIKAEFTLPSSGLNFTKLLTECFEAECTHCDAELYHSEDEIDDTFEEYGDLLYNSIFDRDFMHAIRNHKEN